MATQASPTTITILGAGYVGLTTAALLAHAGYKVYAVEPNKERLEVIKAGRSFFYEQGLDPVIKQVIDSGNLVATDSYAESVAHSSIVFSSVGTPDNPDGSSNLTYVFSAAEQAATYLADGSIYVQKSTVPVGTGRRVEALFTQVDKSISYVSNPEFLREGTALSDTLYFDRVVAGGDDKNAVIAILDIYRELERHRDEIAAIAGVSARKRQGQYISTSLNSAELIKVTANAFLALKISFANSIAKLADKVDADIVEVMDAVGADERIGRAFLNAGRGYGGGCFPKDVSGLIASGLTNGVDLEIMQAAQSVNQSMPGYVVEKLQDAIGTLDGKNIAVLGLAFKAGTSDTRKSPGVAIANLLAEHGAVVTTHDPEAIDEATSSLHKSTRSTHDLSSMSAQDAVIIATEWPEYKEVYTKIQAPLVFDAVGILDQLPTRTTLIGIGRRWNSP